MAEGLGAAMHGGLDSFAIPLVRRVASAFQAADRQVGKNVAVLAGERSREQK